MQVTANWKLPIYQVLGPIIRVHWDYRQQDTETNTDNLTDTAGSTWIMQEAVVPLDADRHAFIHIVDAAGGPGNALADGWFNTQETTNSEQ
jgi:hypothetical protein